MKLLIFSSKTALFVSVIAGFSIADWKVDSASGYTRTYSLIKGYYFTIGIYSLVLIDIFSIAEGSDVLAPMLGLEGLKEYFLRNSSMLNWGLYSVSVGLYSVGLIFV